MDATMHTQSNSSAKIQATSSHQIHSFPVELLSSIFLYLYTDHSIPRATDDLRDTHKLAFIMLVCKHWRDIVDCSPVLWTDIWLGRGPEHVNARNDWITRLEDLFRRSRTMPLTLTILVTLADLEDASQVLLQHLPRCETLAIQQPEGHIGTTESRRLRVSAVHRILSSPFHVLQKIVIGGYNFHYDSDHRGPFLLDAPNLRFLHSSTSHIIPFIKPHGSPPAHNSLETFSFDGGWDPVMEMLPLTTVYLPRLKKLSLAYTDDFWNILQILDTPNLESLVANCGLAEWFHEVDSPKPVLRNLHELTWYTDSDAADETPNLCHLLQHCPNIECFLYSCWSSSANEKDDYLQRQDADSIVLALSEFIHETDASTPRLCPRLRRLRLGCASFEQIRDLVLTRPALESVSLQYRKPGDDVVTQSKTVWQEKVDLVRWIRSKIEFEFEEADVGPDLQE
ncbi:hypothetical protein FRC00_001600 [Tulasnella sp. 408]|nr:hypothetical protein FRC00_001600 [Tulasnella sp. 408]